MSVDERELYASACEALELSEEMCAGELGVDGMGLSGASTPAAIGGWVLEALKEWGCENQEVVRSAAAMAISAVVKNPYLTAICMRLLDRLIASQCSVDAPQ